MVYKNILYERAFMCRTTMFINEFTYSLFINEFTYSLFINEFTYSLFIEIFLSVLHYL